MSDIGRDTESLKRARAITDAIWQLEHGYSLGALAALRAVSSDENPPAVPTMNPRGDYA